MTLRRASATFLLAATVAGCGSDPSGTPAPNFDLALHGGDGQTVAAGALLPLPLQVKVKDATGAPVRGAVVAFRPAAGSGVELSDTLATSGSDGIARVDARAGSAQGTQEIATAMIPRRGETAIAFTALVGPGPTITGLSSTSVKAGDTLTITGTNFTTPSTGNDVFFGAARALVVDASATALSVVVPPCLTPGQVAVRVEVGSARTNSLAVGYTASTFTPQLALYQGITVAGTELGSCIRLPANGARYILVPQFATASEPLAGVSYTIGNDAAASTATLPLDGHTMSGNALQARFDAALRAWERTLPAPARGAMLDRGAAFATIPALGSTRQFKVLCSLTVGENCFADVTGQLAFVGDNVLVYVDVAAPAGGFTPAELQQFGTLFDDTLYPIDDAVFGAESDIDGNGRVMMLLTPEVNKLTPRGSCTGGTVLGFFFGYDLTRGGDSNEGEVFYGLVPDPQALASCAISKATVQRALPSTFIHEYQHMINYNQHVLVRGGSQETDWLNEGLSHLAEELGSRWYETRCRVQGIGCPSDPNQLFPDSSQGFIGEQLDNAYSWMSSIGSHSVTLFETGDCCEGRGAAWIFLRYLGDRFDSTVYARLAQSNRTSVANLEGATGETFASVFGDFGIALYADSLPGVPRSAIPARYRFTSRNLRQIFQRLNTTSPSTYPLAFPLRVNTLGYATALNATMVPGTFSYFDLATPPGSDAVSLRFSTRTGGAFRASLGAQMGIFRVR